MSRFHFYHQETGILHGNTVVIDAPNAEAVAQLNCPPGHKPIEGLFDPLSQRINVDTKGVIDYQPPAPSADHEWNTDTKRWQISAAAQAKAAARSVALARIAALEASQHAVVRDLLLGGLAARPRLQAIQDEIINLQAAL